MSWGFREHNPVGELDAELGARQHSAECAELPLGSECICNVADDARNQPRASLAHEHVYDVEGFCKVCRHISCEKHGHLFVGDRCRRCPAVASDNPAIPVRASTRLP